MLSFVQYCTFLLASTPLPPHTFLLMILVQKFMLIKNHIETSFWKSTETKLFTSKVLIKSLKVIIKKRSLNTTILTLCWKINKLQNNISRITKYNELTRLEHHYSLTILKNRCQKIFEMPMTFVFTHYLCNVDLFFICILIFWVPKSSYNIVKHVILQIKNSEKVGGNKTKQKNKTKTSRFHSQEKGFLKKST